MSDSRLTDEFAEPVYDIEAERGALSAMMGHPSAIEAAAEVLEANSFYRPVHRVIFSAMVAMMAAGDPVTPVTLFAALELNGEAKALGGAGRMYLFDLYALHVLPSWVDQHAKIVLRYATRRAVADVGARLVSEAGRTDLDEDDLVGRSHLLLDRTLTASGAAVREMPTFTADEVCDADETHAVPLIPGLLNAQERVVVVGPEGGGKSILGLQLGFSAAAGVHPFEHHLSIEPCKVMIIDLENPRDIVQRRFRTFRNIAQQRPGWEGKRLEMLHKPAGLNLTSQRDAFAVSQIIKRSGAQLVIAGPIYKMMWGVKSDLDTHAALAAFWDQVREQTGTAVWLEAHAPYGQGTPKREMRPEGSNIWAKWCEFGVALNWAVKAHDGENGALDWTFFKPGREEGRSWPDWITRNPVPGRGWPWLAQHTAPPASASRQYEDARYGD